MQLFVLPSKELPPSRLVQPAAEGVDLVAAFVVRVFSRHARPITML
jgi:hypothetical protein